MAATRSHPAPPTGQPAADHSRTVAGLLLVVAGAGVLLAIITAEALYPAAYSSNRNTVSDLAAMRPDDIVRQPSAAIFNITMMVAGVLVVVAAVLLYRARAGLVAALPVGLLGLGMLGVGIFPGNTVMAVHQLVSLATFLSGGVAAILTARLQVRSLRPVHAALGGIALVFLLGYTFFGELAVFSELGEGGVERWIVYPVALWMVVLGSGLCASHPGPADHRSPVRVRHAPIRPPSG